MWNSFTESEQALFLAQCKLWMVLLRKGQTGESNLGRSQSVRLGNKSWWYLVFGTLCEFYMVYIFSIRLYLYFSSGCVFALLLFSHHLHWWLCVCAFWVCGCCAISTEKTTASELISRGHSNLSHHLHTVINTWSVKPKKKKCLLPVLKEAPDPIHPDVQFFHFLHAFFCKEAATGVPVCSPLTYWVLAQYCETWWDALNNICACECLRWAGLSICLLKHA